MSQFAHVLATRGYVRMSYFCPNEAQTGGGAALTTGYGLESLRDTAWRESFIPSVRSILNPQRPGLPRCEAQGIRLEFDERAGTAALLVPAGTAENSPPFQRWEKQCCEPPAPSGATEHAARWVVRWSRGESSVVPDGTGWIVCGSGPPLKRWAIFGCPCRDNNQDFPSRMTTLEALPLQGSIPGHTSTQGRLSSFANPGLSPATPSGYALVVWTPRSGRNGPGGSVLLLDAYAIVECSFLTHSQGEGRRAGCAMDEHVPPTTWYTDNP